MQRMMDRDGYWLITDFKSGRPPVAPKAAIKHHNIMSMMSLCVLGLSHELTRHSIGKRSCRNSYI